MIYAVEFEGFFVKKSFVFKEICVRSVEDNITLIHFFIRSPYPFERLTRKERGIVKYCEENLHGIFWYAGHNQFKEVRHFIQETITSDDVVYTKGNQKVDILKRQLGLACSVIDIEAERPEAYKSLAEKHPGEEEQCCPLSFHRDSVHCAVFKTLLLKNILKEVEESSFENTISENEQVPKEKCTVLETDNEMSWTETESSHSISNHGPDTGSE